MAVVVTAAGLYVVLRSPGGTSRQGRRVGATTSTSRPGRVAPSHPLAVDAQTLRVRLPAPRSRSVVIADDNGLAVLGGLDAARRSTADVWQLDAQALAISPAGRLAVAVHDAAGARIGGSMFVFGGGAVQTVDTVQSVTGGRGTIAGHLPQARSDLVAVSVGGTSYVLAGFDGKAATPSVLATTDGRTFRTVANLLTGVRYPAVAAVGSTIYVIGGEAAGRPTATVQRIDLTTGRVSLAAPLSHPLAHAAAAVIGGHIVVAGGRANDAVTDEIALYDPASGSTPAGHLPAPAADCGSALLGDRLVLVGGEGASTLDTVVEVSIS